MTRLGSVSAAFVILMIFLFSSNSFAQQSAEPQQLPGVANGSQVPSVDPYIEIIYQLLRDNNDPELNAKLFEFLRVYYEAKVHYVDDKTPKDFMNLAMKGLVEGLDPYSHLFIDAEASAMFERFSEKNYNGGIGVSIGRFDKNIFISEVFEGNPAFKAGLEPGDIILSIDAKSVYGMNVDEVIGLIGGPNGTNISLEIRSSRFQQPTSVVLVRQKVVIRSIEYKSLDRKNGYIKIRGFNDESSQYEFFQALVALAQGNKEGLIIDLRDNGGGSTNATSDMLGFLIGSSQLVAIFKERNGEESISTRTEKVEVPTLKKIVVLVNNYSASASEIMSGVLKYYKAATIIGVRTFGKATAQDYMDLDREDHAPNAKTRLLMGITVARYLLPDRTDISKSGVEPDIEVEQTDNFRLYQRLTKKDRQFQEALRFLKR